MTRLIKYFLISLSIVKVSSCGGQPTTQPNPDAVFTSAAETAAARLTETSVAGTNTALSWTPTPTETATSTPTLTPIPTLALPVFAGTMVPMPPVAISADNPVVELARWQASSTVMDVAFSPDGKILASADGNGVTFWDVSTGEQLGSLKHESSPNHIAFSPDGKLLASTVPSEGTVYLWDIASNKILYTFKKQGKTIRSLAFSPDGRELATGWNDRVVIWNVAGGYSVNTILDQASALAFSPDGRLLAVTGRGLRFYDPSNGDNIGKLFEGTNPGCGGGGGDFFVGFSQDGSRVVAVPWDPFGCFTIGYITEAKLFGIHISFLPVSREEVEYIALHGAIYDAAITADGRFLAVGGGDGMDNKVWGILEIIDISNETCCSWFDFKEVMSRYDEDSGLNIIEGLAFSPDGRYLATGEHGGAIRLWGFYWP